MEKKKTGLLFGSFNPIHIGHLALADYFLEFSPLNDIWFVVSPHNPVKERVLLLPEEERLKMVKMAIEDFSGFSVCDAEFYLPKPSYTINTLKYLTKNHPDREFVLIIGEDNLMIFDQWKDHLQILDNYKIFVYNRSGGFWSPFTQYPNITFFEAPLLNISSTFIRESIRNGKNMRFFLPKPVFEYIEKQGFYKVTRDI